MLGAAGFGAPAAHGADASQQLLLAERLRHVVVGAGVERLHLGGLLALAGQDDDRGRSPAPDLLAHGDPIESGHRQVQDHQVRAVGVEAAQRLMAVVGGTDPMPDAADQRGDGTDHGRLVVDDQDAERRIGAHPVASGRAVTNWLPPAGLSSIQRRPSMAPTRRRAAKRPTPAPGASVSFSRTNGSKTLSR